MPNLIDNIQSTLQALPAVALNEGAGSLLATLGYQSDKTMQIAGSSPDAFLDLIAEHNPGATMNKDKALFDKWLSADILFQFTDDELSDNQQLFADNSVKPALMRSYLFFAIELKPEEYARGKLTAIAPANKPCFSYASDGVDQTR